MHLNIPYSISFFIRLYVFYAFIFQHPFLFHPSCDISSKYCFCIFLSNTFSHYKYSIIFQQTFNSFEIILFSNLIFFIIFFCIYPSHSNSFCKRVFHGYIISQYFIKISSVRKIIFYYLNTLVCSPFSFSYFKLINKIYFDFNYFSF